jgi:hypothetical protein
MHVFICWSGRRSRRIAEAFDGHWLREVLGAGVTSFVSFEDIEKGEGWFDRLLTELGKADAALLCLTPENLASPWMHFEAGMVSRLGRGRVFTWFLGTEAGRIQDPLKQIQVTVSTEADTARLARSLARLGGIAESEVDRRLASAWPAIAAAVREVGAPTMEDVFPGFTQLFERKTFQERLEDCADQLWLKRYEGARDTARALAEQRERVRGAAEPWQVWLYDKLVRQVDGYVDEIKKYLLLERPFDIGDGGRIDFARPSALVAAAAPASLSRVCERRCREIRHVVFCLSSADGAPVLPEALQFAKLQRDQRDDKKRVLHARPVPVGWASLGLRSAEDLERCARSVWDYDRILYYKARESEPVALSTLVGLVGHELERASAEPEGSRMALHYAVKTLTGTLRRAAPETFDRGEVARLVRDLQQFLAREAAAAAKDDHQKIQNNVEEMRTILASPAG